MAYGSRGVPDGSGPYAGSYRRRIDGSPVGRRLASQGYCTLGEAENADAGKMFSGLGKTLVIGLAVGLGIKWWMSRR